MVPPLITTSMTVRLMVMLLGEMVLVAMVDGS